MAFRQIKAPALANQAVIETKLDVTAISGQVAASSVGSLANDTFLMHSAENNALRKLSVQNLVNSLSTDNLTEGSNLYFTNARAQAAVAQDIADAVSAEAAIARAAEQANASAISAEVTRATAAEEANAAAIAAEETRALAAESAIDTAYKAADATLQSQINNIISNVDPAALDSLSEIVTAFQTADSAMTAAIQANAASISAEITRAQGAESTLQSNIDTVQAELDATQAGAGLGADGSYTADGAANYISGATSLSNADVLLDSAIKAVDTAYKAADIALDGRVNTLEGEMDTAQQDIIDNAAAISAEETRATAAEQANAAAIAAEVTARATAVQGAKDYADAQDDVIQEELDATQVGAGLNSDGSFTADGTNSASATSLKEAIKSVDDALVTEQSNVDTLQSEMDAAEGRLDTAESDIVALETVVGDLGSTPLDTTAQTLAGAINEIHGEVDAVEARVTQNETDIATNLASINNLISNTDPEALDSLTEIVAAFQAADSTLTGLVSANQTAINNEVSRATAAEATLQSNIDSEATTRAAADTTLQSNIDSEEADRIAADSAIQSELDATQAGAGLGADGAYTANGAANYISAATSMVDADNKLDAALKAVDTAYKAADTTLQSNIDTLAGRVTVNEGDIADNATAIATEKSRAEGAEQALGVRIDDVQSELDATQTGAGLGADGSYSANGSANYISTAVSLKDADNKLDAQAKVNADAIAAETQARIDAVAAEAALRVSGDNALQANIDNENTARIAGDNALDARVTVNEGDIATLQSNLTTEIANRISGDSALDSRLTIAEVDIDAVEGRATTLEGEMDTAEGRLDTAETDIDSLEGRMDTAETDIVAAEGRLDTAETDIVALEGRMDTAETDIVAVEGRATTLEGEMDAAEGRLDTVEAGLAQEILDRAAGDTATLSSANTYTDTAITNLVNGADVALDTLKEIGDAFAAADSNLQNLITTNSSRLDTAEADIDSLEGRMDTAEADIVAAEGRLDTAETDIVALEGRMDTAETDIDANTAAITAEAARATAAEGVLETDLAAEVARATAAEGVLQANIDAEATTRAAADSALDGRLTTAEADIVAAEGRLDTAETDIVALEGRMDTAETDINANTAAITAEAARATAAEGVLTSNLASLQTEVDAMETSLGLAGDGTFVAHSGTNYIDDATSFKNADVLLDSAIKAEESARTAAVTAEATARANEDTAIRTDFAAADTTLQQAIDAVETGAGLGTDGAYTANGSANYISAATTLKDADNKLDVALKAVDTAYKAADVTLQTNIDAEATTRASADTTLQANIDAEATTRAAADSALDTRLTAAETEITATQTGAGLGTDGTYTANGAANYISAATSLKDADNKLDTAIKNENTRATGEEVRIEAKVDAEVTRATAREDAIAAEVQTNADNLAQEIIDRAAADTNLQNQINNIISNTDPAALDSLTEIVAAFQAADNTITGLITSNTTAINNEVARATAAEGVLQDNIDAEEAARITADTTLQSNIDGKVAKTGDTMSGVLNMGSNVITGLAQGSDDSDAVNVAQLNAAISAQDISVYSTDDLTEGSNLYYTDARARAAISVVDTEGNGDISYNNTTGVLTADLSKSLLELTDVTETTYTGAAAQVLVVNDAETGVEFVPASELQIFGNTYRQVIEGDGTSVTYALNFLADETSSLVFVGGVIQDPSTHYTISDINQTITFNAVLPIGTQAVVIVRELVGAQPYISDGSIAADKLATNVRAFIQSGVVNAGTGGDVIDSFDGTAYRTAKYIIQVANGSGEYETREALVLHNGTSACITEYAMLYTGAGLLGDASVRMNGDTVELVYTANANGTSVKVISTYIDA
jgi:predicted  nucleic acid-binding Zn-ribbon protein